MSSTLHRVGARRWQLVLSEDKAAEENDARKRALAAIKQKAHKGNVNVASPRGDVEASLREKAMRSLAMAKAAKTKQTAKWCSFAELYMSHEFCFDNCVINENEEFFHNYWMEKTVTCWSNGNALDSAEFCRCWEWFACDYAVTVISRSHVKAYNCTCVTCASNLASQVSSGVRRTLAGLH